VSIEFVIGSNLDRRFTDLAGLTEHVGFLLADWSEATQVFVATHWRPVEEREYEVLTDFHVALTDDVRAKVIKWAWDNGGCLVETHSHGPRGVARFSPSDIHGFEDWVPHVWWRLGGRPYAALVTTGETVDGWAWTVRPTEAAQIDRVTLGSESVSTTGASVAWVRKRR
jgi:hypothetical protein